MIILRMGGWLLVGILLYLILKAIAWVLFRFKIISGDQLEAADKPIKFPKYCYYVLIVIIILSFLIIVWEMANNH